MPKIDVVMDCGGEVRHQGSKDILHTTDFGGCTAIYAYTDDGLYGLYHLRSTLDGPPDMRPNATDSNEPYRQWVETLQQQAHGHKIHFQVGTPWLNGKQDSVIQTHPDVGMERYLHKLCTQYNIEDYDITLMNMVGVKTITVDESGMTCYTYNDKKIQINPAQYQTDEELFEHSSFTTEQCLNNIKSFPNIDFDGTLLAKYQKKFDQECSIKAQKKMKEQLQSFEENKHQRIKTIKQNLLVKVTQLFNKYDQKFEQSAKGDMKALLNLSFVKALSQAVELEDLELLQDLKTTPEFNALTEKKVTKNLIFTEIKKTELGLLFDEVESKLTNIQSILNEDKSNLFEEDNARSLHQ